MLIERATATDASTAGTDRMAEGDGTAALIQLVRIKAELPGVLTSPHVGGNTSPFLPRARRLVADQLRRFADGEPLASVVSR